MIMFLPAIMGVGLAASALGGLFKTGLGIAQMIKSGRMKPQRPTYEVSDRIAQNLALRQANLPGRMAGAAEAEANLRQSTASQLANVRQAAGTGAQALASGALAQAQENRGLLNLQSQEAQDYQRRLGGLERANLTMAAEERQAWDYNLRQKYDEEAKAKARTLQAGLQNTYSGIQGIGGMAGQAYAMESLSPGFFGQLFKGGQSPQGMFGSINQGIGQSAPQLSMPNLPSPGLYQGVQNVGNVLGTAGQVVGESMYPFVQMWKSSNPMIQ